MLLQVELVLGLLPVTLLASMAVLAGDAVPQDLNPHTVNESAGEEG